MANRPSPKLCRSFSGPIPTCGWICGDSPRREGFICPDYLPFSEELAGIPYCPEKSFTVGFAYLGAPSAPMEKFLSCIRAFLAECGAPLLPGGK